MLSTRQVLAKSQTIISLMNMGHTFEKFVIEKSYKDLKESAETIGENFLSMFENPEEHANVYEALTHCVEEFQNKFSILESLSETEMVYSINPSERILVIRQLEDQMDKILNSLGKDKVGYLESIYHRLFDIASKAIIYKIFQPIDHLYEESKRFVRGFTDKDLVDFVYEESIKTATIFKDEIVSGIEYRLEVDKVLPQVDRFSVEISEINKEDSERVRVLFEKTRNFLHKNKLYGYLVKNGNNFEELHSTESWQEKETELAVTVMNNALLYLTSDMRFCPEISDSIYSEIASLEEELTPLGDREAEWTIYNKNLLLQSLDFAQEFVLRYGLYDLSMKHGVYLYNSLRDFSEFGGVQLETLTRTLIKILNKATRDISTRTSLLERTLSEAKIVTSLWQRSLGSYHVNFFDVTRRLLAEAVEEGFVITSSELQNSFVPAKQDTDKMVKRLNLLIREIEEFKNFKASLSEVGNPILSTSQAFEGMEVPKDTKGFELRKQHLNDSLENFKEVLQNSNEYFDAEPIANSLRKVRKSLWILEEESIEKEVVEIFGILNYAVDRADHLKEFKIKDLCDKLISYCEGSAIEDFKTSEFISRGLQEEKPTYLLDRSFALHSRLVELGFEPGMEVDAGIIQYLYEDVERQIMRICDFFFEGGKTFTSLEHSDTVYQTRDILLLDSDNLSDYPKLYRIFLRVTENLWVSVYGQKDSPQWFDEKNANLLEGLVEDSHTANANQLVIGIPVWSPRNTLSKRDIEILDEMSDGNVDHLTPDECFDLLLRYEGIINYTSKIKDWYKRCFEEGDE